MSNDLAILEAQFKPLAPRLEMVLDKRVSVNRLLQTIMISVERLPMLLKCDRQSLFNSAMSAAVLGLEVDGVTGQAYLIPFAGKAQLVIGYRGLNTLAARSGITITGAVVREGDEFDFELGSRGYVRHKPALAGGNTRRIIGAWACATSNDRPPVHAVMGIDEIMAVKARSPGAKRSDSPWNDPSIGFPAMAEKTVKRRLARSMPLNIVQLAARMDEAVDEQGAHAHIDPDRGVIVEGEVIAEREPGPTPTAAALIGNNQVWTRGNQLTPATPQPSASPITPGDGEAEELSDRITRLDGELQRAAVNGMAALKGIWDAIGADDKAILKSALDRRHKVTAQAVDAANEKMSAAD